jgi:hypothetical protein
MKNWDAILDAAKALNELSEEAAKKHGYESGGGGDDTGGGDYERVTDPSGKIFIQRGRHWGGPRSTPTEEPTTLSLDGTPVDYWNLDDKTRKALDAKVEQAFKPLLDALEREKVEAPHRKAREEQAKRDKEAKARQQHSEDIAKKLRKVK